MEVSGQARVAIKADETTQAPPAWDCVSKYCRHPKGPQQSQLFRFFVVTVQGQDIDYENLML